MTWRKGVKNLFHQNSLKILKLERVKEKKLPDLPLDLQLEELWISASSLEDLSGLNKLKNLKILQLDYLRSAEDSNWLKNLKELQVLRIASCKKMSNKILENISNLKNLKEIFFSKMGEIPSIEPIIKLKKIETIGIIEDTKITDGNLYPILELPNLKKINIQAFKHYEPTVITLRRSIEDSFKN